MTDAEQILARLATLEKLLQKVEQNVEILWSIKEQDAEQRRLDTLVESGVREKLEALGVDPLPALPRVPTTEVSLSGLEPPKLPAPIPSPPVDPPSAIDASMGRLVEWATGVSPVTYLGAVIVVVAMLAGPDALGFLRELWSGRAEITEAIEPRPRFLDRDQETP